MTPYFLNNILNLNGVDILQTYHSLPDLLLRPTSLLSVFDPKDLFTSSTCPTSNDSFVVSSDTSLGRPLQINFNNLNTPKTENSLTSVHGLPTDPGENQSSRSWTFFWTCVSSPRQHSFSGPWRRYLKVV